MFTPAERDRLRSDLLESASRDKRITGAAITGSASVGREDRWSDIDLAFGIATASAVEDVISGARDNALALACLRHGLPVAHGRGIDLLPGSVRSKFDGALVRSLDASELLRAFGVVIDALLSEVRHVDEGLVKRLHDPLMSLVEIPSE